MTSTNKERRKKTSPAALAEASRAKQQELFGAYEFSPRLPNPSTKEGIALDMMLSGETLTQPKFLEVTNSWRLAASIHKLINEYGWAIESQDIPAPCIENPYRHISKYYIKEWALKSLEAYRGYR